MPSEKAVLERNVELQNKFYEFLESGDNDLREELLPLVKELHNHQWTNGPIYNILDVGSNCYNNCKYCYMKRIKSKFFGTDIENLDMVVDQKKVDKSWKKADKKTEKIIMFPSSHDIFSEYLNEYVTTAKKMLVAGHTLLIVTKPRHECIKKMIKEFDKYKSSILFRLTITTTEEKTAKYYEPNAPSIKERINCLKLLSENGYRTSVSIEPFLSNPKKIVDIVEEYVSDDIWIGCMSGLNINNEIDDEHKKELEKLYGKKSLSDIMTTLQDNKKVFWKTSVMKIILRKK